MNSNDEAADLWVTAAFLTGRLYDKQAAPLAVTELEGGSLKVAIPLSGSRAPEKNHSRSGPTLGREGRTRSRRKRGVAVPPLKNEGNERIDAEMTAKEVVFSDLQRDQAVPNWRLLKPLPTIRAIPATKGREISEEGYKNGRETSKIREFPALYSKKLGWEVDTRITDSILENSKTFGSFRREKSSSISNLPTSVRGGRSFVVNEPSRSSGNRKLYLLPEFKFDLTSRRVELERKPRAHLYLEKVEREKFKNDLVGRRQQKNSVPSLKLLGNTELEDRPSFYNLFYGREQQSFYNSTVHDKIRSHAENQNSLGFVNLAKGSSYNANNGVFSESSPVRGVFGRIQNSFDRNEKPEINQHFPNHQLTFLEGRKPVKLRKLYRKSRRIFVERNLGKYEQRNFPFSPFHSPREKIEGQRNKSGYNKRKEESIKETEEENEITKGGYASREEERKVERLKTLKGKWSNEIRQKQNPDTKPRLSLGSLETHPELAESDSSMSSGVQESVTCAKCLDEVTPRSPNTQLGQIQTKGRHFLPLREEEGDAKAKVSLSEAFHHLQKNKRREKKVLDRGGRVRRGVARFRQTISRYVTTRCSPTKEYQLFAASFPLGIYPARVSVLLGTTSVEDEMDQPFPPAAPPPAPPSPKRRSDIFPEDEYGLGGSLPPSQPPSSKGLNESSFLMPLPEPRGPGPPVPPPSNASGGHGNSLIPGGKLNNTGENSVSESISLEVGQNEEDASVKALNSSSVQGMWTMETLQKVKKVVDSILRSIGSSKAEFSERKENETLINATERVHGGKSRDFKSPLEKKLQKEDISLRSNQKKFPHIRPKQEKNDNVFPETNEFLVVKNGTSANKNTEHDMFKSSSTKVSKINISAAPKGSSGSISSVTDLLFTVPNLRVIQPVENSRVDSAIKSTEKLVLTSLTDLLYSAPTKRENSTFAGKGLNSAEDKAFPARGSVRRAWPPPGRMSQPLDGLMIESSCIPVGSRGTFKINNLTFVVVGRNASDRREKCWEEVERVVERHINVPLIEGKEFLASGAFYFVAQKAKLIDSNSSCGVLKPSIFLEAAKDVCSENNSNPLMDPLACLDYQFMGVLLVRAFKLSPDQDIMVCDALGGFHFSDALGAAVNFLRKH